MVRESLGSSPGTARRLGELLRVVYPEDHPMRVDPQFRSRALALRLFACWVAATATFWVVYGVTLQPGVFFVASVLTFFTVMRLRALTKPRD